jgi:nicotinate (nicotinamide) nucleotide adenylyltransferase
VTRHIALFGGSFNPPGRHHREIAAALSRHFDEVIVVPCGPRPDKPEVNFVSPVHRAAMVDLNFAGLDKVRVELFDLEACTFTRTCELEKHFAPLGEIWHVVGADLLLGGGNGGSAIHTGWRHGEQLWRESRFAVLERPGYPIQTGDLPPRHRRIPLELAGSSSQIRSNVYHGHNLDNLLTPAVAHYIERHGLYRGVAPSRQSSWVLQRACFKLVVDEGNPLAVTLSAQLQPHAGPDPELIVVVGGDGTMLRAIREHWRMRVPFYGLNAGHLGFLLNQRSPLECLGQELALCEAPLLYVQAETASGERLESLAFNDAWVERATGQTAWIQVKVNGVERLRQLVADGAIVSTPSGSTAYARAMGAIPLPLNTPALLLAGSNVLRPAFWRPAVLPFDSTVELRTLDPEKRPLKGYIDGVSQGLLHSLSARASNIAAAELVFTPEHDPAAKLAQIQFPEIEKM